MARASIRSRLEKVSKSLVGVEVVDERTLRHREILSQLYFAFPRHLRSRFVADMRKHSKELWKHHAIDGLYGLVHHSNWVPTPLPEPLALVYLDDPQASPGRQCLTCKLPLPERWGHFVDRATGKRTFAPLWYFKECPGCGGTAIRSWMYVAPDPKWAQFPLVPNERFDFKEQTDFSLPQPWRS